MLSLQAHVFGSSDELHVDQKVLERVLAIKLKEHRSKGVFLRKDTSVSRRSPGAGGEPIEGLDQAEGSAKAGSPEKAGSLANGTARAVARAVLDSARGDGKS